tara:strand:+ start:219 stop:749 length:531 start_codon:yes stop_codon:yes gene_type:complete
MATQLITVNTVLASPNFNVSSAQILANASDDSNSTSFENTQGNQLVTFGLEGTGDYANLAAAASIVSIQPIVTMAAAGKGAASVNTVITDDGSAANATVLSTTSEAPVDLSASVYTPSTGLGGSKLNGLEFNITGNTGGANVIYRVRFLVTFILPGGGNILFHSGKIQLGAGNLSI